jgi:hypothetical protein
LSQKRAASFVNLIVGQRKALVFYIRQFNGEVNGVLALRPFRLQRAANRTTHAPNPSVSDQLPKNRIAPPLKTAKKAGIIVQLERTGAMLVTRAAIVI